MQNSIKKNYIFNLVYQILAIALPVITTPYISRVLGAKQIGAYNYTYSIAYFYVLFANLGSGVYAQREIAVNQSDVKKRSMIFWEIFALRLIVSLVILPVYIVMTIVFKEYTTLFAIESIFIISVIFDISWLFQGMEDFKITAVRNTVIKLISTAMLFVLVRRQSDLLLYVFVLGFSTLLSALILWKYLKQVVQHVPLKELHPMRHLKETLILFFPIAAINIYTVLDKVELGWLSNNQQVGFYSQTENIVKIAMTIITSLSVVLLPAVSKLVNENRMDEVRREIQKAIQFTFYIGCPMTMGMITVAPVFIPWFLGEEFSPSIKMFQILSILVIIISLSQILGNSILLSMRYEKIYTISIVMSAVINLVLNFLLIPKFAAYGAIVATIASEVCVGAIQQTKSIRLLNIRYRDIGRQIINPTVAAIVMGGVLFFLEKKMHPSTIEVLGMIVTGGAIYAAVLLLLHDQFMKSILTPYISKLRRKN